jgi:cytochrome c-type biogenesis protein CcmE
MTRKQRRATMIFAALGVLGLAVGLVLFALNDSIVFFHSPSDILEKKVETGKRIRLGGLVKEGSVKRGQGTTITFEVTDMAETIPVRFTGVLPDLFREGQGVITEGVMNEKGVFIADSVLAKHDENYMPPEVAESLKKDGHWQGGRGDEKATGKGAGS